jgi:hypothetical protein
LETPISPAWTMDTMARVKYWQINSPTVNCPFLKNIFCVWDWKLSQTCLDPTSIPTQGDDAVSEALSTHTGAESLIFSGTLGNL